MKKRVLYLFAICILNLSFGALAFAELPADHDPEDLKATDEYELHYMMSDLTSPWTTKGDRLFYSGAVLSAFSLWFEQSTNEQFQKSTATTQPLGEASGFGNYAGQLIPNALYGGGMVAAYYFSHDANTKARSLHRAFFMFETTLYASTLTTLLKTAINEHRPDRSDTRSFPSGHATTAFAFAGVVGIEHEWYYAVPAYGLAAFVAYSRLNDNAHYLHDVIAGATIGVSYAFGIWYNRNPKAASNSSAQNLFILPTDDLQGSVLTWQKHF